MLNTKRFINRNYPTILTVIGAVGFVLTIAVYMSGIYNDTDNDND